MCKGAVACGLGHQLIMYLPSRPKAVRKAQRIVRLIKFARAANGTVTLLTEQLYFCCILTEQIFCLTNPCAEALWHEPAWPYMG